MKIQYVSFDGVTFETENECKEYESRMTVSDKVKESILAIAEHCDNHECCDCPFRSNSGDDDDYGSLTDCRLRNNYPIDWGNIKLPD